ncbi:MAG: hypothetical protein GX951_03825 [Mollicutes bacterium]|nr:hypothetical protein [Mollicutes bacterium]
MQISTLSELYNRLLPAFKTKKNDFKKEGIEIRELDLWNYLKENVWKNNRNLTLYEMINDIFNVDINKLNSYINKTK